MSTPVIAIPTYRLGSERVARWPQGGFGVPAPYVDAVRAAGGRTLLVPERGAATPEEVLSWFDGLLLVGGGDVEPSQYGAEPTDTIYGVEPDRDDLEIELLLAADRLGVPTLAICRGAQVMNVAFGGTLHRHLPDLAGLIPHGVPLDGTATQHTVTLSPGSRILAACNTETFSCSSHHHQGIDELGAGLVVTARSDDGLAEAIEREDGWMLGVQWHPETSSAEQVEQRRLFEELVARSAGRGA